MFGNSQQTMLQANAYFAAGNLQAARQFCEQLVAQSSAQSPNQAEAFQLLGLIAYREARMDEAVDLLEKACQMSPRNHVFLVNLGSVYAANRQFDKAAGRFAQAVAAKPGVAESHYNLANARKDLLQTEDAIKSYRKAITLRANYPAAWNNLGALLLNKGDFQEAQGAILRAVNLKPDYSPAHHNLGSLRYLQGRMTDAICSHLEAIRLNPDYVEAYKGLSVAYAATADYANTEACITKLRELAPNDTNILLTYASQLMAWGASARAVQLIKDAIALDNTQSDAWVKLGIMEWDRCNFAESRHAYAEALRLADSFATRILAATCLSPILSAPNAAKNERVAIENNLDALIAEAGNHLLESPLASMQAGANFFLAYNGFDNRVIQQKFAALYETVIPSLNYTARHCMADSASDKLPVRRRRVGFFSKFIYNHSVATSFGAVVVALSQNPEFEIFLISDTSHDEGRLSKVFSTYGGAHLQVPRKMEAARHVVASLALDVLVFMDIGMDAFSYFLAFSRLAPVQCVLGGHPETTGIKNVDYFLSPGLAEPADSEEHYSETLVRLDTGG